MVTSGHAADGLREAFQFEEALPDDTRNVTREPVDTAVLRQRDCDELIPAVRHLRVHNTGGSAPDADALVNLPIERRRPTASGQLELTTVTAVVTGTDAD